MLAKGSASSSSKRSPRSGGIRGPHSSLLHLGREVWVYIPSLAEWHLGTIEKKWSPGEEPLFEVRCYEPVHADLTFYRGCGVVCDPRLVGFDWHFKDAFDGEPPHHPHMRFAMVVPGRVARIKKSDGGSLWGVIGSINSIEGSVAIKIATEVSGAPCLRPSRTPTTTVSLDDPDLCVLNTQLSLSGEGPSSSKHTLVEVGDLLVCEGRSGLKAMFVVEAIDEEFERIVARGVTLLESSFVLALPFHGDWRGRGFEIYRKNERSRRALKALERTFADAEELSIEFKAAGKVVTAQVPRSKPLATLPVFLDVVSNSGECAPGEGIRLDRLDLCARWQPVVNDIIAVNGRTLPRELRLEPLTVVFSEDRE